MRCWRWASPPSLSVSIIASFKSRATPVRAPPAKAAHFCFCCSSSPQSIRVTWATVDKFHRDLLRPQLPHDLHSVQGPKSSSQWCGSTASSRSSATLWFWVVTSTSRQSSSVFQLQTVQHRFQHALHGGGNHHSHCTDVLHVWIYSVYSQEAGATRDVCLQQRPLFLCASQ